MYTKTNFINVLDTLNDYSYLTKGKSIQTFLHDEGINIEDISELSLFDFDKICEKLNIDIYIPLMPKIKKDDLIVDSK